MFSNFSAIMTAHQAATDKHQQELQVLIDKQQQQLQFLFKELEATVYYRDLNWKRYNHAEAKLSALKTESELEIARLASENEQLRANLGAIVALAQADLATV
jgi:hypothetical protein